MRVGRWAGLRRGHGLGMVAGVSPVNPQTPGTTSVSSAPGLSAPAATSSSTGASTLERNPCSECAGRRVGRLGCGWASKTELKEGEPLGKS